MIVAKEQQDNKPFQSAVNELYKQTQYLFGRKQLPQVVASNIVDMTQTIPANPIAIPVSQTGSPGSPGSQTGSTGSPQVLQI